MKRCSWAKSDIMQKYHDTVWGKPEHNDTVLFEFLILEGAQAGLSWESILKRKDAYKEVFLNYDIKKISELDDKQLEEILQNPKIIRNRRKVFSVRQNSIAFINIQKEFGSFNNYIWSFTNNKVIDNKYLSDEEVPSYNELSDSISKDLKRKGFNFVGKTIIYSYLQAIGIINDHIESCEYK